MTRMSSRPAGSIAWVDLSTTDQPGAKEFYARLFGWTYQDAPGGPDAVYSLATLDGAMAAAIAPQPPGHEHAGVPPMWQIYFATKDADATVSAARSAGGEVFAEPFDVMDSGRMAVISDPTGAVFCVWQANQHAGFGVVEEPGAFAWAEVNSRDREALTRFYCDVFGWAADDFAGTPAGYTMFSFDGAPHCGALQMDDNWEGVMPHWMIYFQVDDPDATADEAIEAGGSVQVQPFDTSRGRIAVLADPVGANFSIVRPTPDFQP